MQESNQPKQIHALADDGLGTDNEHVQTQMELKPEDIFRLWDVHRTYVVREDTLINERFSRLTTIQGFLITAYGVAAAAYGKTFMDFLGNCMAGPQSGAIWILRCAAPPICAAFALLTAAMGALSTYRATDSILAAREALDTLRTRWERYRPAAEKLGIPGLQGAGSELIHDRGHAHAVALPRYLGIIWSSIWLVTLVALGFAIYAGIWKLAWGHCV